MKSWPLVLWCLLYAVGMAWGSYWIQDYEPGFSQPPGAPAVPSLVLSSAEFDSGPYSSLRDSLFPSVGGLSFPENMAASFLMLFLIFRSARAGLSIARSSA